MAWYLLIGENLLSRLFFQIDTWFLCVKIMNTNMQSGIRMVRWSVGHLINTYRSIIIFFSFHIHLLFFCSLKFLEDHFLCTRKMSRTRSRVTFSYFDHISINSGLNWTFLTVLPSRIWWESRFLWLQAWKWPVSAGGFEFWVIFKEMSICGLCGPLFFY